VGKSGRGARHAGAAPGRGPRKAGKSDMSKTDQSQTPGERPAWRALADHHRSIAGAHLRQLFAEDGRRGERLTAEGAGIFLDLPPRTASPTRR